MKDPKIPGLKEQIKGAVDLTVGKLTGNEDQQLRGQVEITNGSNQKDRSDFEDNVKNGVDTPDNPSNE
jgi:uncharacterized protein YjbJ (UPF0337 family)